ncbi:MULTISPECIES: DUF2938 domain-containing protein [Hydrocarboniphaga]|uniref:DUF2938 domain-containing protein n=1 Tax=Hydrocarboniphaga effusa AP103 TaxID=1172194 RepID=I7ZJG9_9GAMM|nr:MULTISPECIES: DUF2938 domain-containing protein [Hydrocarboniphaga]EIT71912.1 hypothetical protein WQQ_20490 [Hydrocarboniphaga effusa AP103]MDZ4077383.1 DUF2938 domain-containing protein [Hydrocarboniphaga sp.]
MSIQATVLSVIAIGCGATLVMDAWLLVLRRLGIRAASFGLIGRWAAHSVRGRFIHASIATAKSVRGELALGWLVHYAVGILFASLLVASAGPDWIQAPTPAPAVLFGLISVAAPLLIMQPAMGAGFLASKTPKPWASCLRSAANHCVFGAGLYLAAAAVSRLV